MKFSHMILTGGFACSSLVAVAQTKPKIPPIAPVPKVTPLGLPPSGVTTIPDVSKPLDATEASEIAVRLQPNTTIAYAQMLSAEAKVKEALSGLYPQASLTSSYSYLTRLAGLGTSNSSSGSGTGTTGSVTQTGFTSQVLVKELIYDFNRTRDQIHQQEALAQAAKANLTKAQSDLVFQVKTAFYTALQNQQLVDTAQANVKSRTEQLSLALANLQSGLGAPVDYVTAATNLADSEVTLIQSEQTSLVSTIGLAALMGVDPRTPLQLASTEEPIPDTKDLNQLVMLALHHRPEILAAQQTLKASGYALKFARTNQLPSLSGDVGAGSRGPQDPFGTDTVFFGISLTWTFFDSGNTAGIVKDSEAQVLQNKAVLQQAILTTISDVSQSVINLQGSAQRVSVAESEVKNAALGVKLAEGQYRAGVATFLGITQAEATYETAKSNLLTAQAAVQTARAQLVHAIGILSPSMEIKPQSQPLPGIAGKQMP